MVAAWEINLALDSLGLTPDQKQTVLSAVPIATKMIEHIDNNQQLFDTLYADMKLILPAFKIILEAINASH